MAKRFGGFTPEQLGKIVPEMSGMQSDEQEKFLAANPGAAARVGAMTDRARKMIEQPVAMAEGGILPGSTSEANYWEYGGRRYFSLAEAQAAQAAAQASGGATTQDGGTGQTPYNENGNTQIGDSGLRGATLEARLAREAAVNDPSSLVSTSDVQTTTEEQAAAGLVDSGAGQLTGETPQATLTEAQTSAAVAAPETTPAETYFADKAAKDVEIAAAETEAAKGEVRDQALVEAQVGNLSDKALADAQVFDPNYTEKVDPGTLSVQAEEVSTPAGQQAEAIRADVAQSDGIRAVVAEQGVVSPNELPEPAQIREEDMAQAQAITAEGLAPDAVAVAARLEKFTVDDGTLAEAAQGNVQAQDTVQYQLSELMKSFDDGTPAWAAGAIRAANAAMASRGLAGSSMMGAAIYQAAMESALPIAQQDAATFANMNLANLNNRQQVALSNAAAAQGLALQNLNNEQQAALQNSANSFALQSQNLSNMQQTMLANAQIKAALQGQNLSNQQQANLVVAARYSEVANLNLNNRQQAALQNNSNNMQIELSNLNNKQQAYIANANLAAALQGKQIDTAQQSAIFNASRFADAANITFSAEQQAQLHNSELMKTIGLANLNASQAATLQNAAQIASMDMANLNNRQQAAVMNAQSFLQMDLTNLSNEQQMALFEGQSRVQAILSDQAAENAALQFNAASENQTNQFFAGLTSQINQFNAEQFNLMERFNAGEANALDQFNIGVVNQREQFNAANSLIIEQANSKWYQTIATMDNAFINEANREAAAAMNNMTTLAFNAIMQESRDIMSYAFQSADNDADRATSIAVARMQADAAIKAAQMQIQAAQAQAGASMKAGLFGALGKIGAAILPKMLGLPF